MANFVVKVVDGKPVIFGSAGKDTGVPCYVFEDEEAYDAAMAEGLVPVGSLIFKTYDGAEMAGGPFDTELGDSDNAVQNRVVKAAIDRIDQSIAEALALRASLTGFGLAKICPLDLTDVTEDNGMVLGAVEKNASIEGTISNIFSNRLTSLINKLNTWSVLMNRVHINGGVREDIDLIDNMEKYMMVLFVFEWDISYSIMSQSIVPTSVFSSRNQHLILYSASGDVHIQFWHITGTRVGVQMADNQYVSASILGFGKI